jgi:hypothetical protein
MVTVICPLGMFSQERPSLLHWPATTLHHDHTEGNAE